MTKDKIKRHEIAAERLESVNNEVFKFIKKNIGKISEYDIYKFITLEFKKQNLITDKDTPIQIIAINQNAAIPHYFPPEKKSEIIRKNDLILIDTWAKLKKSNSPFADITWIAYSGRKVPLRVRETFKIVIGARNVALGFIKKELKDKKFPKTRDVDKAVRNYFKKFGLEKFFIHSTGHSLGSVNCHGKSFNLSKKSKKRLKPDIPFTIEPGLYFKNKFGIRSEINCYITKNYKLVVTTKIQQEIVRLC